MVQGNLGLRAVPSIISGARLHLLVFSLLTNTLMADFPEFCLKHV